ncbi:RICIN domain-containing protein [Streptomyces sp. NPDC002825]|uniref:RICIN domain-containing protein n=1 Tax=Streptomyces sp. NPDC002825 TaxID=3154666 RepID=UPI00332F546E
MKLSLFSDARRALLVLAAVLGLVFGVTAAPAQAESRTYDFTFKIHPRHAPDMCLEVADWSKENGAAVRQWPCHDGPNQKWRKYYMTGSSTGPYWYVNVNSGKCLEIRDWATYDGAVADQWDCHYGANQTWYGNSGLIYPSFEYAASKCLEIADWSLSAGAPARLWSCTGGANQSFNFEFA